MKWLLFTGLVCAVAAFGAEPAGAAYDYVDIGDTLSEAGHNLAGWGPIEPEASGGTYGGIDDCRVIYAPGELEDENWATVDLDFGPPDTPEEKCLVVRILDGISGTDSFDAFVNGNYVGSYNDDIVGGENWITTEFNVSDYSGVCTVKFVSTEPPWDQFDQFGQVAIDEITVWECTATALSGTTWGCVKALYR